jgi:hypothetical protein
MRANGEVTGCTLTEPAEFTLVRCRDVPGVSVFVQADGERGLWLFLFCPFPGWRFLAMTGQ